jgi:hypothetical protein
MQYALYYHVTLANLSFSDLRLGFFERESRAKRVVKIFFQERMLATGRCLDNVACSLLRIWSDQIHHVHHRAYALHRTEPDAVQKLLAGLTTSGRRGEPRLGLERGRGQLHFFHAGSTRPSCDPAVAPLGGPGGCFRAKTG